MKMECYKIGNMKYRLEHRADGSYELTVLEKEKFFYSKVFAGATAKAEALAEILEDNYIKPSEF